MSYAAVASSTNPLQGELNTMLSYLQQVKTPPDTLVQIVRTLRNDMESAQQPGVRNFGSGQGGGGGSNWRSGVPQQQQNRFQGGRGHGGGGGNRWHGSGQGRSDSQDGFHTGNSPRSSYTNAGGGQSTPKSTSSGFSGGATPTPKPAGRYQSHFLRKDTDINEKILNTVIGNKLNAFTQITYNDTRDFIYQIIDSGETDFIKDFVEKVFKKATCEELYCALFAKLIAEIAQKYPVIYEEMDRYHQQFLKIFETVQEDTDETKYAEVVEARMYRMGYGLFLSELAGQNALEKQQLFALVQLVVDKVWELTAEENRPKAVEEFVDCLVRLVRNLKERSPRYFGSVRPELESQILEKANILIAKTTPRPSLSSKARYALMDLRDLILGKI